MAATAPADNLYRETERYVEEANTTTVVSSLVGVCVSDLVRILPKQAIRHASLLRSFGVKFIAFDRETHRRGTNAKRGHGRPSAQRTSRSPRHRCRPNRNEGLHSCIPISVAKLLAVCDLFFLYCPMSLA